MDNLTFVINDNSCVYINNQQQLNYYINDLIQYNILAIDTEFNRNNKEYLPQLCLLQICYKPNFAIIIDCLANLDLTELINYIYNPTIVKIFHACRQDIEMLFNITKAIPQNIFDTQIAVMATIGKKDLSYNKLVQLYLNIELDKTLKHSNWHIRPLTTEHINYAALDVLYLYQCYNIIKEQLKELGRKDCLEEEFNNLNNPDLYVYNTTANAKKLLQGLPTSYYSTILNVLIWREDTAKQLNLSRSSLLDTKYIKQIVTQYKNENFNLSNFVNIKAQNYYSNLTDILHAPTELPKPNNNTANLSEVEKNKIYLLKLLLQYCSHKYSIHSNLIANLEDINDVSINYNKNNKIFLTWRYDIFGKYVEDLLNGKVGISFFNNNIVICQAN